MIVSNEVPKRRFDKRLIVAMLTVWGAIAVGAAGSIAVQTGRWEISRMEPEFWAGLGAENDSIARAMRSGRGFADPFEAPTGPTAWMPPAFPTLLAALYMIANDDRGVVENMFMAFQWSTFALLGTTLVIHANRATGQPLVMAILFAVGSSALGIPIFLFSHGQALEVIAVTTVLGALLLICRPSLGPAVRSGLIAGVAALTYPAAAIAWAVVAAWQLRHHRLLLLNALLAAAVVVGPWVGRNYAKFGVLVPIKSNASFELWQSIKMAETGIIHVGVFKEHPYARHRPEHRKYASLGENTYLGQKQQEAWRLLRESPLRWVRHVQNRLVAALAWPQPWFPGETSMGPVLLISRIWKLTVLASLWIVYTRRRSMPAIAILAASLMLCILTPYILVSYYERYAWPVFPLQLLVVFYCVAFLSTRIRSPLNRARSAASTDGVSQLRWANKKGLTAICRESFVENS